MDLGSGRVKGQLILQPNNKYENNSAGVRATAAGKTFRLCVMMGCVASLVCCWSHELSLLLLDSSTSMQFFWGPFSEAPCADLSSEGWECGGRRLGIALWHFTRFRVRHTR